MSTLSEYLAGRGLSGIEEIAGITENGQGMLYPSSTNPDYTVQRWKAFDSDADMKYRWQPAGAKNPKYYALPGFLDAIKNGATPGEAHFCFGEPDVWTMHKAGYGAAFCCFGDNNFPAESFLADIRKMGITLLYVWPDHDEAGVKLAATIFRLLAPETDLAFVVRFEPKFRGTHYDLNRFWLDAMQDADVFNVFLNEMPGFEPPAELIELEENKTLVRQLNSGSASEKQEVERQVRVEIEGALVKRGGKEGVYECPLPHSRTGKDFLYTVDGPIGACQGKHGDQLTRWMELALFLDIDVTRIAREVARVSRKDDRSSTSQPAPDRPPTTTGKEARQRFDHWMVGKSLPPGRPLIWPYTPIQVAEGNATVLMTRLGVLIVSISGGGKTSHIGTLIDAWRADDIYGFLWSPENSPEFHEGRAIARWGGPSVSRQRSNLVYQYDVLAGRPDDQRRGSPYTPEEQESHNDKVKLLDACPGDVVYPSTTLSTSDYCEEITKQTWEMRVLHGKNVAYFACDYAQRTKFNTKNIGQGWDILEHVAGEISQCAIDNDLIWILMSQAKKDLESRIMRGNTILGSDSAQGLTDYLPQLMYTLNPLYRQNLHEPNAYDRLEKAKVNVCKNNDGRQIVVTVKTDLAHYLWPNELAAPVETEEIEEDAHWSEGY